MKIGIPDHRGAPQVWTFLRLQRTRIVKSGNGILMTESGNVTTAGPDIMDIFSTLACFMRPNPCCIKAKLIPTIKKAPHLKDAARVPEPTIL